MSHTDHYFVLLWLNREFEERISQLEEEVKSLEAQMMVVGGEKEVLTEQIRGTEEKLSASLEVADQLKNEISLHLKEIDSLKTSLQQLEVCNFPPPHQFLLFLGCF